MWRVGGFFYIIFLYKFTQSLNEIEIKRLRLNIYLDKGYYLPIDRLVI